MATSGEGDLAPRERAMLEVWRRHLDSEFREHNADAALETMSATPHLNHVPVMTGGVGREEVRHFYISARGCRRTPRSSWSRARSGASGSSTR